MSSDIGVDFPEEMEYARFEDAYFVVDDGGLGGLKGVEILEDAG